jgi:6-phosphogluconolactonase (cycloisomerase 2 family)
MTSALQLAASLIILTAAPAVAQPLAEPFQTVFDGTGLAGVEAIAATSDGRHVYAAGNDDLTIVALARNGATGRLTRIAVYREGDGGFDGISPAARLLLAPDGRTLYAAGGARITALRRDPDSGKLSPGRSLSSSFGITQIADLAVSADGERVFAAGSSSLAMFAADAGGDLAHLTTLADGAQHDRLGGAAAVDCAGGYVYVGSATDRSLSVFRIEGETLAAVQTLGPDDSALLGAIADVAISADDRHLYAAVADGDRIAVLSRDGVDGSLATVGAVSEAPGRGLAAPSRMILSSDDRRLYVASAAQSSVALLERDPESGALTAVRAAFDDSGGVIGIGGSADLALGPAQTHLYVSGPSDGAIGLFDAALAFLAVERNSAGAIGGMRQPTALAVAPDGGHLYVAGFGSGAVAVFRRGGDGSLEYGGVFRGDGEGRLVQPISLAFSDDGTILAVADFGAGAVQTLRRDVATGALQPLSILDSDAVADLRGVAAVAVAPGADLVAAVSLLSGSVVLMTMTPDTAALALRATMPALAQPSFAAFSADGDNLYTTSSGSAAVVVFERTPAGPFAQLQVVRDSDAEISGLVSPASLAITGDEVYVASGGGVFQLDGSNAVTVFDRDAPPGTLRFRAALVDRVGGVEGLRGATAVAVSPQADTVAAAGFAGNSLAVFERDESGDLFFVEAHFDGKGGADGLGGASALAFSPGGGELYVAGFADNAITAFRLPTPIPPATATATPSPSQPATATPTLAPTPIATATATTTTCAGDCNADATVGIAELIRCVNIALGSAAVDVCVPCDVNGNGEVAINELIQAVNAAQSGCS